MARRPLQTHLVAMGRFRHSGYIQEDVIYAVSDGRTLAVLHAGRWTRPVIERREAPPRPHDLIRPLGPAVRVVLTKGRYY